MDSRLDHAMSAAGQHGAMIFRQDSSFSYTSVINPLFELSEADTIGRTDHDIFDAKFCSAADELRRQAIESGQPGNLRSMVEVGGKIAFVDLSVSPLFDDSGTVNGLMGSIFDLTEFRRREQQLSRLTSGFIELTNRFNTALDGSAITIFEQDQDLRYTFIHNPPPGTAREDYLGRTDVDIMGTDGDLPIHKNKRKLLEDGESAEFETDFEINGVRRTYEVRIEARKDQKNAIIGLIGTAVDISENKQQERRWHLVMREMTHRTKNLFAVIQAMARQTAARSQSTDLFVKSFTLRINAMATSHDLLVSENWKGVELRTLVDMHVAQVVEFDARRISIEGPDIVLSSSATQNLGLALHELTTNAVKYGSLSEQTGQLAINWSIVPEGIAFKWCETGGPTVLQPERLGFGRSLLETAVGASLDGKVDLDFNSEGLVCSITIPFDHAIRAE